MFRFICSLWKCILCNVARWYSSQRRSMKYIIGWSLVTYGNHSRGCWLKCFSLYCNCREGMWRVGIYIYMYDGPLCTIWTSPFVTFLIYHSKRKLGYLLSTIQKESWWEGPVFFFCFFFFWFFCFFWILVIPEIQKNQKNQKKKC